MLRLAPVVLAAALALAERTDVGNLGAADNAWLILVDDLHLSFTQTGRLRDLLRKVAAELNIRHAGDWLLQIEELRSELEVNINRKVATDALFMQMASS